MLLQKKNKLMPSKLIMAVSLLHMANANGSVENEQINYLLTIFKGDTKIVNHADRHIKDAIKKGRTLDDFLEDANKVLSDEQKRCIVANMIDIMYSDGRCDAYEQKLLDAYISGFGHDYSDYLTYIELSVIKNNHEVF